MKSMGWGVPGALHRFLTHLLVPRWRIIFGVDARYVYLYCFLELVAGLLNR